MSIQTVLDRLAKIQRTIQGVNRAAGHDDVPNTLRTEYLPCFINLYGPAESQETFGQAGEVEARTYRMLLFVCSIQRPSDIAKQTNRTVEFLDRVKDAFRDRQNLDGLTNTIYASAVRDEGQTALEYPTGTYYAGVEFQIDVMEVKAS